MSNLEKSLHMNRLRVMTAAWFAIVAIGKRPSRRTMQDMVRRILGGDVTFGTDEVQNFLRDQHRRSEACKAALEPSSHESRSSSGPVQVQFRSSLRSSLSA